MTVSNTTASITLPGDGSATTFDFNFEVPYQDDGVTPAVAAYTVDGTGALMDLVLDTDYSIAGVGDPDGGTVTYPLSGPALASGAFITILRALKYTQPFTYTNTNFRPDSVEQGLDWVVMEIQQLALDVQGALRVPPGEVIPALAAARARRGKIIQFDATTGAPNLVPYNSTAIGADGVIFDNLAAAMAGSPTGSFLQTEGYLAAGDGGGAVYASVGASSPYGFTAGNGTFWEITGQTQHTRQWGLTATTVDGQATLQLMADYLLATGAPGTLVFDDLVNVGVVGTDPNKYAFKHGSNVTLTVSQLGAGMRVKNNAGNYLTLVTGYDGTVSNTLAQSMTFDMNAAGNTTQDVHVGGNGAAFALYYNATDNRIWDCVALNAPGVNTFVVNGGLSVRASIRRCTVFFLACPTTTVPGYDNSAFYIDSMDFEHEDNLAVNVGAYGGAVTGHEMHGAGYVFRNNGSVGFKASANVVGENAPNANNGFRAVRAVTDVLCQGNWGINCKSGITFWALNGANLTGVAHALNVAHLNPGLFPVTADALTGWATHLGTDAIGDYQITSADNLVQYEGTPINSSTPYTGSAGWMLDTYGGWDLRSRNDVIRNAPNNGWSLFPGGGFTNIWPAWSSATTYYPNQGVTSGGQYYRAKDINTNSAPPSADWTAWTNVGVFQIDDAVTVDCGTNASAAIRSHGILRGICIGSANKPQVVDDGTGSGLTGGPTAWNLTFPLSGSNVYFDPAPVVYRNSGGVWPTSTFNNAGVRLRPLEVVPDVSAFYIVKAGAFVQDYEIDIAVGTGVTIIGDGLTQTVPTGFRIWVVVNAVGVTTAVTWNAGTFAVSGWVDLTTGQSARVQFEWQAKWVQITPFLVK